MNYLWLAIILRRFNRLLHPQGFSTSRKHFQRLNGYSAKIRLGGYRLRLGGLSPPHFMGMRTGSESNMLYN